MSTSPPTKATIFIQDFNVRDDKFVFSASGFDGLEAGPLVAGQTFIANKVPPSDYR